VRARGQYLGLETDEKIAVKMGIPKASFSGGLTGKQPLAVKYWVAVASFLDRPIDSIRPVLESASKKRGSKTEGCVREQYEAVGQWVAGHAGRQFETAAGLIQFLSDLLADVRVPDLEKVATAKAAIRSFQESQVQALATSSVGDANDAVDVVRHAAVQYDKPKRSPEVDQPKAKAGSRSLGASPVATSKPGDESGHQ